MRSTRKCDKFEVKLLNSLRRIVKIFENWVLFLQLVILNLGVLLEPILEFK